MTFTLNGRKYRIALRLAVVATITRDHEPDPAYRIIASDAAIHNPEDIFDPAKGAKLAITRALQQAFPLPCQRAQVWDQILGKIGKKANAVFHNAATDVELFKN